MTKTRLEEAQVYKQRVQAARRAMAGLYVTDDITRRHAALAMILDIADSEIERVIEFEQAKDAALSAGRAQTGALDAE